MHNVVAGTIIFCKSLGWDIRRGNSRLHHVWARPPRIQKRRHYQTKASQDDIHDDFSSTKTWRYFNTQIISKITSAFFGFYWFLFQ